MQNSLGKGAKLTINSLEKGVIIIMKDWKVLFYVYVRFI